MPFQTQRAYNVLYIPSKLGTKALRVVLQSTRASGVAEKAWIVHEEYTLVIPSPTSSRATSRARQERDLTRNKTITVQLSTRFVLVPSFYFHVLLLDSPSFATYINFCRFLTSLLTLATSLSPFHIVLSCNHPRS